MRAIPWVRTTFALLCATGASACVAPQARLGTVSAEALRSEALLQQQRVLQANFREVQRLEDVAYPILKAATSLCGEAVGGRTGMRFANVHSFSREFQPAARALGFSDTLMVTTVTKGSPAEAAGFQVGDRVHGLGERPAPVGRKAVIDLLTYLAPADARSRGRRVAAVSMPGEARFTVRRGVLPKAFEDFPSAVPDSTPVAISLPADTACRYGVHVSRDQILNASADGQNVYFTTAMMRFAGTDDELAAIVAHEVAHNAMGHLVAKQKNAAAGAFFGALVDIAAASQGINTGGEFTNTGASFGAMSFSQDFEREADYVGLYLLARAGRPLPPAAAFWRRMAEENPTGIKFASSHPTSTERFVRLEQAAAEIEAKRAAGAPLDPEMRAQDKR